MNRFGKVAVLMGGASSEREISLLSGESVLKALVQVGVDAHAFDPAQRDIWQLKSEGFHRAFIILHGKGGEDGSIQGALQTMKMPYTGSGVAASAIAMDKWRTKMIWDAAGIPTPRYAVVNDKTDWAQLVNTLGLPLMLKAAHEGSSIGIVKVNTDNVSEIARLYREVARYDALVIAESFVTGMELTSVILNDRALPLIKIVAPNGNYDFQNKYYSDETRYFCPSGIDAAIEEKIKAEALHAFRLIGCKDWGRLDVILREDGSWSFLEINTVPGMTGHSLVPMAARAEGISFERLCVTVLEGAYVE
jgi:D-alanine-D-alanine ligase